METLKKASKLVPSLSNKLETELEETVYGLMNLVHCSVEEYKLKHFKQMVFWSVLNIGNSQVTKAIGTEIAVK